MRKQKKKKKKKNSFEMCTNKLVDYIK